jgi:RNA polymerase sigma factor (sigma-70 family)
MSNEELAIAAQRGDTGAMGQLWEQTAKYFAVKAKTFYRTHTSGCTRAGVTADDLLQCCYFALIDAVSAFKPGEYKLLTYTNYPLKTRFSEALYVRSSKRDPLNNCASLDAPLSNSGDNDGTLADTVLDTSTIDCYDNVDRRTYNDTLHAALEQCLDRINPRQSEVIRAHWFEGTSFATLALQTGTSRENISAMARSGYMKLSGYSTLQRLADEVLSSEAYHHVGVETFQRTGTSELERAVLLAERLTSGYYWD